MIRIRVSAGGQISLPASIRRRWATESLVMEDLGDRVIVRPMPADPIGAVRGSVGSGAKRSSTAARNRIRREEARAEKRKYQK